MEEETTTTRLLSDINLGEDGGARLRRRRLHKEENGGGGPQQEEHFLAALADESGPIRKSVLPPPPRWSFLSRWALRFLRVEGADNQHQPSDESTSPQSDPLQNQRNQTKDEKVLVERAVVNEERRQRGVLVANMLLTLTGLCFSLFLIRLRYDGLEVSGTWLTILSMVTYACLFFLARWRRDYGELSALLTCLYANCVITFRTIFTFGVRSETFGWLSVVPVVAFCLLGQRGGVVATVAVFIESWLIFFYTNEDGQRELSFDLSCVRIEHDRVYIPSDCSPYLYDSKVGLFASSTTELVTSKSLRIVLMSAFAYIYESNRCDALRRMKEALLQKEKVNASLRQATNAKTAFLANMSHELRTPMHGIIAMAKDLMEAPLGESARESARIVSDCADHLLGLVNDILDFARIESNQLELEAIALSVGEEVEKAVSLHAAMAKKKRVSLLTQCVDIIPRDALRLGDPLRFRQILINLLSNAIKFTPEGGRVMVTASTGAGGSNNDPELITVRVADTGIGIPNQFLDHIFESFSQLDASVGRKFGGSGLGLAISKKLCRAMRGGIRVTSEEGVGSVFTFTVRLPLANSTASNGHPSLASPESFSPSAMEDVVKGKKVLVVEDNLTNQKVATRMLTSLGCHVQLANHGAEGVERFEREAFDAILMDVQMPVMDGFQATARIRELEFQQRAYAATGGSPQSQSWSRSQSRRVPIIALTASATRDYQTQCLEKGMDRFLTKPLKKETLQLALADVLLRPSSSSSSSMASSPSSLCCFGPHDALVPHTVT